MSKRHFEQSMNPKEHIQSKLRDAGISHPSEWRKALDLETPLDVEKPLKVTQREIRIETKVGKIENDIWQKQLDTAFEQENYDLIQTLRRVRPESIPNPEIIRNRLNELVVSRPSGWVDGIKKIRSVVNVEADPAILGAEFSKLLEQYGQGKGILDQLETFKKATGYNPEPEAVQARYRGILAGKKSSSFDTEDLFKNIINLTGIKPDSSIFNEVLARGDISLANKVASLFGVEISSEMIQQAYEDAFAKNGYLDIRRISDFGEKPNVNLVQRAYQKIIVKRYDLWVDSILSLKEATDIQPIFTEEQVRPFLEERLNSGRYDEVKKIVELTGIKPDVDLVKSRALKIIDDGHGYIDQGQRIKEGLKQLSESVGIEFKIPESEIQNRYKNAIVDKKPHVITNLHGAFDIKPSVDQETARQFMVELMDDTYHNTIPELEKAFGFKFKATKEEIEAKQDENLEKFRFDNLEKIKTLTGEEVNKQKLESALAQLLTKEATTPPHARSSYEGDWEKKFKQLLEQFGATVPQEDVLSIYETLVSNYTIYSGNIAKTQQITGVPLPAELAQRAYEKILSPGYVIRVSTGQGPSHVYGLSVTFAEIYKITGIAPQVPTEKVQQFYGSRLKKADFWEIKNIIDVTGVKPVFDQKDINQIYKEWILDDREDYIRNAKEITGIDLQLDEKTAAYVSQEIEAGIEKVRSVVYKKNEYGEKKLEKDIKKYLRKVGSLTVATGVKLNLVRLQSAYSEVLATDPYWATKIEQILKATGIKPVFSPEQLQTKGQQLLEQGSLRDFERLQAYGKFTFTPELVAKTYDALLDMNRRYDDHNRKHYYNEYWVDRIKRFKELTGIAPTETQLVTIFSHISQDDRIAPSRYGDSVEEKIKFFVENFQTEITGGMVKDVAISYLARGDVNNMKKFIEKVGVIPELTDADLLPHVNRLLEAKELNPLAHLKQEMKLDRVPASETAVQSAYQHFAIQEDFGKENSRSLQAFKQIFELTGVQANFPAEQTDQVYKTTRFAEWQKLNEVIGTLPSNEVVQYKYLQFFTFTGGHYGFDKNIEAIRTLTGQSPEAETVTKALEHFASEGKIEEMSNIVKIAGGKQAINPESGQEAYRKITEQWNSNSSSYWVEKLTAAIDFLNDTLGIRPDRETMYQIYSKTFGQTDYKKAYEDSYGKRIYPQFWEFLVKKFGKPDPEVVQRIYLDQLDA